MSKIISKHLNVLHINPQLRGTFQNNPFVAFKRNKNLLEFIVGHTIKNGKIFKTHSKTEKENVNLATQVNHHHVGTSSLKPNAAKLPNTATIHHISQTQLQKQIHHLQSDMLEKLKQLLIQY